ncbi:MAG TPA: SRPBCC family protein [Microvirga sp.]|jgi:uncharacterized protein YndB with AHSA1/START domain|nr:SRPBCC family protein [Microvirga sp.]
MTDQFAANHELVVTRLIDAPPETVYKVWTERTGEWWAPRPYTTPEVDFDLRPGGRCRALMRAPDGTDMPDEEGVFLEVVPNRKIVFTNAFAPGWIPQNPFMVVIVAFDPEGSGTRYTARVLHWNEETLKQHEQMGFHEGWGAVAGQLAELAESKPVATAA